MAAQCGLWASPGSLLEMSTVGQHPRPTQLDSGFSTTLNDISLHPSILTFQKQEAISKNGPSEADILYKSGIQSWVKAHFRSQNFEPI